MSPMTSPVTTPAEIIIPILLDECNAAGDTGQGHRDRHRPGDPPVHDGGGDTREIRRGGRPPGQRSGTTPSGTPRSHVDLGTTRNGGRIHINREVFEADFKIGIGSIVPHHICGFSGGAKIVQPGISGEATTAYTHLLSVRAPRSYLGILDNPVREEMDEIARRTGLTTILNTVLNRHGPGGRGLSSGT